MTIDRRAATQLAARMISTWPAGPRQGVWFDVLVDLDDLGLAEVAYKLLRDQYDRVPTVATYRAEYVRLEHARARQVADARPSVRVGRTAPPWIAAGISAAEWTIRQRTSADQLAPSFGIVDPAWQS
jgi:hypothetical protein